MWLKASLQFQRFPILYGVVNQFSEVDLHISDGVPLLLYGLVQLLQVDSVLKQRLGILLVLFPQGVEVGFGLLVLLAGNFVAVLRTPCTWP